MFSPASLRAMNSNLTLLPAKLRSVGCRTHGVGKWHLGYVKRRFLPTSRGFMTWLGYLEGSEDHFTQATGDGCAGAGPTGGRDRSVGPQTRQRLPFFLNTYLTKFTY